MDEQEAEVVEADATSIAVHLAIPDHTRDLRPGVHVIMTAMVDLRLESIHTFHRTPPAAVHLLHTAAPRPAVREHRH